MCRRGFYRGRYQRHLLTDNLPRLQPELVAFIQDNAVLEVVFDNTRSLCHRCWQRAENLKKAAIRPPPVQEVPEEPQQHNVDAIHVPEYSRAPNTPRHCIFHNCQNTTRQRIPELVKIHKFYEYRLYIPDGARVCQEHLQNNNWAELPQNCLVTHDFNATQFSHICDMMRNALQRGSRLDFNARGALSDEEMHFWTGRNNE
ncbi:unnamed protein product [Euphydryas editha]|uniref:Uncharacterized protein n=1 Tax=Euphydryas editha TaxID=104508 RepID=A0AAU9UEM2_EUPED|nr:unnamed protein product [Euphydryas editha]